MQLLNRAISCPYCGHSQNVDIDASGGDQDDYYDCRICCNPIHMRLHLDESRKCAQLYIDADDEQIY
ncbi:CPXCG motif-containing cysteine-rich protein [Shewanella sp. SR44-3]|uniref:CPXCG motif-containing cysteine-rich protein n=1 Tax=unclassified Shewanella TaxID=196818 RepID=UPI0015F98069|nr:CPXCG motif-containing cysteine-rich protein [Shewanella sp. SR44-3]MBB1267901.1 CPXCG motif-containing cysteine-rich protein [Shewanella sp. SR44-3]